MSPLRLLAFFLAAPLFLGVALHATAQTEESKKLKELKWGHAFDLAARKVGEAAFTKETQKFGVEAYRDDNTGLEVYLSQTGSLAVAPGAATTPAGDAKGPAWLTGLDLSTRKAGQKTFDKQTKVHSLEVFRDPNADNWLFVTDKGQIAGCAAKTNPTAAGKAPKWVHSVDLSVRKGRVKEWKEAAKVGVEVYRDLNSSTLVFITENGSLAVLPETEVKKEVKSPEWLHGLDLGCRRASEPIFSKETRRIGVEVYRDSTTGNYLLVSETGSLAVLPAPAAVKAPTPNVKAPRWKHGLNMKVRAFGEKEFSEKTKVIGAEVYHDENINVLLYVDENGSIAAAPAK